MSKFAWEPPTKLRVGGASGRPRTARDLLALLGVDSAPIATQRKAVNDWLLANTPDELMRTSLRKRGLAPPIDVKGPDSSKVGIIPGTATFLAFTGWEGRQPEVFPRPTVLQRRPIVFFTAKTSVWPTKEFSDDAEEPVRLRNGTRVA